LATKFPDTLLRTSSGESKVQTHFELLGAAIGDAAFWPKPAPSWMPSRAWKTLRWGYGFCALLCKPLTTRSAAPSACSPASTSASHNGNKLGVRLGTGLGLRSTTRDAPACYLASVGFTSERCCQLDAAYNSFPPRVQPAVTTALQAFNQAAAAPLTVDGAFTKNQKALTMRC
jgi:hypothetical protein